jgi:hypothetical protein
MTEIKSIKDEKKVGQSVTTKDMEYKRDKDKELVKGVFKFYEVPGGQMDFVYKKYKNEKTQRYSMIDGQVYTIPLGVAKHLNNDCWYPVHAYSMDESGKSAQRISQKVKRCGFQSLEFMDIEDFDRGGKQIIQVENMAIPN